MRKRFSIRKLFLDLLVIVCLGVAGWTGYQLFVLHQLSPITGSIIFIVDIGVLIWNISVLRSSHYKWEVPSFKLIFFSLLGIALVLAFAGVQPLTGYKNTLIAKFNISCSPETSNYAEILPGQSTEVEDWFFALNGGKWEGSTLVIKLQITNLAPIRRNFGLANILDVGPELVAIDSTGKIIKPWTREPDFSKGEFIILPPYTKEFYPQESWSGQLKFEMSPYSGETKLYMTRYYHQHKYLLFYLESPPKD